MLTYTSNYDKKNQIDSKCLLFQLTDREKSFISVINEFLTMNLFNNKEDVQKHESKGYDPSIA